jgi:hypothetical protein
MLCYVPPNRECDDANDNERKDARGQKQLKIVFWVKRLAIGAIENALVKQTEIGSTAVPHGAYDTDTQPDTYDGIEHQVHDARLLAGESANVAR